MAINLDCYENGRIRSDCQSWCNQIRACLTSDIVEVKGKICGRNGKTGIEVGEKKSLLICEPSLSLSFYQTQPAWPSVALTDKGKVFRCESRAFQIKDDLQVDPVLPFTFCTMQWPGWQLKRDALFCIFLLINVLWPPYFWCIGLMWTSWALLTHSVPAGWRWSKNKQIIQTIWKARSGARGPNDLFQALPALDMLWKEGKF